MMCQERNEVAIVTSLEWSGFCLWTPNYKATKKNQKNTKKPTPNPPNWSLRWTKKHVIKTCYTKKHPISRDQVWYHQEAWLWFQNKGILEVTPGSVPCPALNRWLEGYLGIAKKSGIWGFEGCSSLLSHEGLTCESQRHIWLRSKGKDGVQSLLGIWPWSKEKANFRPNFGIWKGSWQKGIMNTQNSQAKKISAEWTGL